MNIFSHQIVDIVAKAVQEILSSNCLDNKLSDTGLKPEKLYKNWVECRSNWKEKGVQKVGIERLFLVYIVHCTTEFWMLPKWGSVSVSSIEKSPKPKHLESNSCSFAQFDFSEVYSQGKSGPLDIFWCIEERTTLRSVKSVTPQQCVSGVVPPHRLLVGVGFGA